MARRERSDSQPLGPALTDIILESIADGAFTIDTQWRVTSFNRAAEEITGIPREEDLRGHTRAALGDGDVEEGVLLVLDLQSHLASPELSPRQALHWNSR